MLQISYWYDKEIFGENVVENTAKSCSNCGKQNGLSMKSMNTNYKDIITSFVLNTVLHHVGMSWIIEIDKHLEYYMYKHDSDWITGSPWYNTYICNNCMENCLKNLLEM